MTSETNNSRLGLWLIGARGAISTCVAYGLAGLEQGLLDPVGITTMRPPFTDLPLAPFESMVLGGHDVCERDMSRSAGELVQAGVLPADLVVASSESASAFDRRIRPGVLDGPDVGLADLDPRAAELGAAAPLEQVRRVAQDIDAFQAETEVDRVVVVCVASTEASRADQPEWAGLAAFERALAEERPQPASLIYAYAALSSGRPFVNFTPSLGARVPALAELARKKGVPHCGNDAKTGETLIKTALAPMFHARALRVLTWQGYNMLGNRDGESLSDPIRLESKRRSKDAPIHSILEDDSIHSKVGIDFVPSLHDWKTAWDFIHFQGFLGAKMSLQLTWMGSDSALASPLVIDLIRLSDFAASKGEVGEMEHTACFFKSPLGGGTHDFHLQNQRLLEYARKHAAR